MGLKLDHVIPIASLYIYFKLDLTDLLSAYWQSGVEKWEVVRLTILCGQNLQWVDPLDHYISINHIQSVQHIQARKGEEYNR